MTIELVVFLLLFLVLLFSVFITDSSIVKRTMILSVIVYILVVRFSGFHDDILNYMQIFKYPINYNFYFLREWFFWYTGNFIYHFSNSFEFTFFFFDFLSLFLIVKVQEELKVPSYFILLYFLCFPSVMGFQNILRQFIATILLLYSLSLAYNLKKMKYLFYILSIFTHNSTGLFLPLLLIFNKKKKLNNYFKISIFIVFVLLFLGASTKSNSSHGLSLSFIYIFVLLIISIFIYTKNKVHNSLFFEQVSIYTLYLFLLTFMLYFVIGESQLERVAMMGIQISLPFVCIFIDRFYSQKVILRVLLVLLLISPILIFKNAFNLLVN